MYVGEVEVLMILLWLLVSFRFGLDWLVLVFLLFL